MQGRNVTKRKKKGQVQTRFSHALGSVVCDCSLYSIGSRSGSTFWVEGSKEAAARKALCVCPLCVLLSRRESSQTAAHEGGRGGEEWNTRNLLLNGWIRPHCYESQFTFPGQALEILFMLNRLHLACVKMTEAWIMNDLPPLQEVVIIEIIAKRRSLWTGPGAACFEAPRGAQAVSAGPGLPHSHSHCWGNRLELLWILNQEFINSDRKELWRKVRLASWKTLLCAFPLHNTEEKGTCNHGAFQRASPDKKPQGN